jgi:hypothetical protein
MCSLCDVVQVRAESGKSGLCCICKQVGGDFGVNFHIEFKRSN